jgi:hypothetical protein
MDSLIGERITAAETALEHWRGAHAQTFVEEVNAVLAKMASLKVSLWTASATLSSFPDAQGPSWGRVRYADEITMGARVDVPVEPGTASADTSQLRSYTTTAAGQDERFASLAATVNLEGVTADVTVQRPLTPAERQRALDAGEHPPDLDVTTVPQTDPVDPATLITLPTPGDDVPALTAASTTLVQFTLAVATAFDRGDTAMLARLAGDPEALRRQLDWVRADPRRWHTLTPAEQQFLIQVYPAEVGATNGLPTVVRDQANRIVLGRTRAALEAEATNIRRAMEHARDESATMLAAQLGQIEDKLGGIASIEQRLAGVPGRPPAFLLGFTAAVNGQAIVAIGNPDHAGNVATYVPGMGTRLGNVGKDIERADRMAFDANALDPSTPTSVIMWLGYDAPQNPVSATGSGPAVAGGEALRGFQDGLDIAHTGGGAHQTVIGHSYGSTVTGHAARAGNFDADELVFVGSPGVSVDDVSGLQFDPQHVYATRARHDIIQLTPPFVHGRQPIHDDFGAQVFVSDPGASGPLGTPSVQAHSQYWDDGNEARDNMAAIITGNHDLVTRPVQPTPSPTPGPAPTPPPGTGPANPQPTEPSPTPGPAPTPPGGR